MSIAEVFEKYRHLAHLLSDEEWLPDNFQGRILYDLWQAISAAQQVGVADPPSVVGTDSNFEETAGG